ncbi:MAG: glucodextranase DOMON-like domain-containing protein [Bellilinea sp.]|jgi:alpha-amylase/alpha-mannosidase (GH57 family)
MPKKYRFLILIMIFILALTSCQTQPLPLPQPTQTPEMLPDITAPPVVTPVQESEDEVLYLNLVWHQHQPLYYKNEEGVYTRPWVRVHSTKSYYDMAYLVSQYPDVRVTFNLTPVLLRQLDDFVSNQAKDLYWVMAEKPAAELNEEEKRFILQRFYDVNWGRIIARFPRYQELLDKRGGADSSAIDAALVSFTEQDFLDLQVWFNLAWFDPMFLEQEPLKALVEKGENFSEEDKAIIFGEVRRVMAEVVPLHRQMQEAGQIEITTTPYAHPIIPLLIDTNLQAVGNPGADLPPKFSYPQDALTHLQRSVELYEKTFGQPPRGLWPSEGSVAQIMVPFVLRAGYSWMATGEPVLAKSLGLTGFTRDSEETVNQPDDLYRPYYVTNQAGEKLAVFFRDLVLSDKIGFTYSGVSGTAAAKDLIQRLENIRQKLKEQSAEGPHVVSLILDGENAWEHYPNDGIEFLSTFYQLLSESETIRTITPSEYLEKYPDQRMIEDLFPGAWFSPNYDTWIGEAEENTAWEYLRKTREVLAKYDISKVREAPAEAIAAAQDYMFLAEGSDWFWWYGADQDSGQDEYFDIGFRALLRKVFESLGEPVPAFVDIPIIQARPVSAETPLQGLSSPVMDGVIGSDEWNKAALYPAGEGSSISSFAYAMDEKNLYLRVSAAGGGAMARSLEAPVVVYLQDRRMNDSSPYTLADAPALLGMAASHALVWNRDSTLTLYQAGSDGWVQKDTVGQAAGNAGELEMAIPLSLLGEFETGDEYRFLIGVNPQQTLFPAKGPAQIIIPDLGLSTILFEIEDAEGDDHGPGTYSYPTDAVFQNKAFDLKSFRVSYDEKNLIFRVGFHGPIPNPWGSPNGLAIQTIDIYIDQDPGSGSGARLLLPGRNAALKSSDGWDYALWLEGWTPQVLAPQAETLEPLQISEISMKILVDPAARTVTARVPRESLGGGDPASWGFVVAVLGQEGYPSSGVWRVRDVEPQPAQWRFGGAPDGSKNHTRILDLIWAENETISQEEMLAAFTVSSADPGTVNVDDFAQLEMIQP